jgi:hypothetical protein
MNIKQICTKAGLLLGSLPQRVKIKYLAILCITSIALAATLSHADSDRNQSSQGLAGTWVSLEGGGNLVSFTSDGRMIASIPINITTHNGPGGGNELASAAHGEWIRIGRHEVATTSFSMLSSPDSPSGLTHLIKLTGNYTLDQATDVLTLTNSMIGVYLPDGTLQFPPFPGGVPHFKRVVVGQ